MPPPKTSYWSRYESIYKKYSKKDLYKKLKHQAEKIGLPFSKKGKRGRNLKFCPYEYTAFICLEKLFGHKFREMQLESDLFLHDKANFSTFSRNYRKLSEEYVSALIESFVSRDFSYWIADSTAISTKIKEIRIRGGLRNKELLTNKYHIVIGYDPPTQMTMIIGVIATDNHVSDSQGAIRILKGKKSNAYFLGDSAFNTYELHEVIKKVGLFPLMKPDKKRIKKALSAKAKNVELFSKNIYKELRGIVETVFGGATNAGLIRTHSKNEHAIRLDTLMLALRHNFMASLRLSIKGIFATNSI